MPLPVKPFLPDRFEKLFGPLPGMREARAISIMALVAGAIMCALSLYYGFRGETFLGRPLGSDFIGFYTAGTVLNEHPERLYDLRFVDAQQHRILPTMPHTQMLLFGNAPYIALIARPL